LGERAGERWHLIAISVPVHGEGKHDIRLTTVPAPAVIISAT